MFERFTERARRVVVLAKQEAARLNHEYIRTEHLLLGLVKEGEGVAARALSNLGIDLKNLLYEIEKHLQKGQTVVTQEERPFTPSAKKVLELSVEEARRFNHNYIGTEHILLGLIKEKEGIAAKVLDGLQIDEAKVQAEIMRLVGGREPEAATSPQKSQTPALEAFGRDLSELAREGKLDPVIGREDEIERVIQILARRTKNNPVLIGEAGVGKTAIVEGLAQAVVSQNVPDLLLNRRVLTLDLAGVVAGTKYRGQFEERMKAIMKEIRRTDNIILFIDELHTIVGAGAAEGAVDASNMMKPALARGEMQCIGATTMDEFRRYIEKDAALARRFQSVIVEAPTVDQTVEILLGLRDKYEAHHRVKISDEAIVWAARLSDQYIADRFLPDKAVDVIDEACSRVRLISTTRPPEMKEIEKEIENVTKEKEAAIKGQEYEKAANLRDEERQLREKLEEQWRKWEKSREESESVVSEEDVAYIVSKWTGVPVMKLEEKESERLLQMPEELHKRIVGQDEAIQGITRAIQRARAGLKDPKRPVGSFLFLGPTGVGKTLLAKALAEFLFGDEEALIQVDMSEYMEKFNVSRLSGAPPGYVGYNEGGQVSEKVRRRPYSIVLFDEIEKAHPDIFDILLQVLEEGHLTDSTGRKVDFRNTVVILTSNIGTRQAVSGGRLGFQQASEEGDDYEDMKSRILEEVKRVFNPEFLNRIDETVVFHSLTREECSQIVDMETTQLKKRLQGLGIQIVLSGEAREFLIQVGFDPTYGARPLRRAVQQYVEDPLSEEILKGKIQGESCVEILHTKDSDRLEFKPTEVHEEAKL